MSIKKQDVILQEMTDDFIAEQNGVSHLGKESSARAYLNAVSHVLYELWNDLYQTKRGLHVSTAAGADLDVLASRWGITRLGARASNVVLLFNGPATTVIPTGAIIKSSINSTIQYAIQSQLVLGAANPNIVRPIGAVSIGDIVIAQSILPGSATKVSAKELNELVEPITGVTVTNLAPSMGGADAESDEELRARILSQIDLLAQGTIAFYQACARAANETVLLAKPLVLSSSSIIVSLVKNNLGNYTSSELTTISEYIYTKQRALQKVTCINASRRSIEISAAIFLQPNFSPSRAFSNVAAKITDYIGAIFGFAAEVNYNQIATEIMKADGVTGIDLSRFFLNNGKENVRCSTEEVPVFTYLQMLDTSSNITESAITQSYLIV